MTAVHVGLWLMLMAVAGQSEAYGQEVAGSDPARIAKGKNVYVKYCAGCHGAEGDGGGYKLLGADPANLTSPSMKKKSDAALLKTIHEGKPNMPSWKVRLSEQDGRAVLAYIRTLTK
ncbi:MAG: cytochrome c [Nitrospira sp.]|nr:cytochrome c [Nitrospira sp.]MBH0185634.1 cytochrome c [Nitrospira sp.]